MVSRVIGREKDGNHLGVEREGWASFGGRKRERKRDRSKYIERKRWRYKRDGKL